MSERESRSGTTGLPQLLVSLFQSQRAGTASFKFRVFALGKTSILFKCGDTYLTTWGFLYYIYFPELFLFVEHDTNCLFVTVISTYFIHSFNRCFLNVYCQARLKHMSKNKMDKKSCP